MSHRPLSALAALLVAPAAVLGILAAPVPSADAAAPVSGRKTCSTAKGKLRATHTWSPNGRQTFHQVFTTSDVKLRGKSALTYTYKLHSVKNSANAPVSYMRGARVFSTKRGTVPRVTVTWYAKVPLTLDRYLYASCTTK